jgi:hypothetical protein
MFDTLTDLLKPSRRGTVEELHTEFYASGEQRKATLAKRLVELEKETEGAEVLAKLTQLGFDKVSGVATFRKRTEEQAAIIGEMAAMKHFAQNYPQYKFISHDDLLKLCAKYNLFIGWPERFIGEVPVKNAEEILNWRPVAGNGAMMREHFFKIVVLESRDDRIRRVKRERNFHSKFVICAPKEQFDLKDVLIDKKTRQLGMVERVIVDHDPIVLRAVQYGFLIITAWGPEAAEVASENRN